MSKKEIIPGPTATDITVDLVVVGSGTGMAAALAAHELGLKVLVIEKTALVGGSTARSGGAFWIPANPVLKQDGSDDTLKDGETYLTNLVGDNAPKSRWENFLQNGSAAVEMLERTTPMKFFWAKGYSDYFPEADRQNLDALGNMYITSSFGAKVPLKQVVDLQPSWHTGAIVHRNGLRTLTVSSEAQLGRKPAEVFAEAQPKIDSLELPKGVKIAYGGEYEDGLESGPKMGKAFMISFVLIFLVLLFQFKRVGKVFIVLASFPLSLLGAMLGLFLTGYEFGFMAIIGITALLGIVVRNGIILVDYADELVRDHGHTIKEAALLAAKRRMRPIFLTSMAAAIGLIPLMSSGSPEWGPISSTISIGILVSMVTTLFIVPVLYSRFVKPSKKSLNKGIHDKYDFHHES